MLNLFAFFSGTTNIQVTWGVSGAKTLSFLASILNDLGHGKETVLVGKETVLVSKES